MTLWMPRSPAGRLSSFFRGVQDHPLQENIRGARIQSYRLDHLTRFGSTAQLIHVDMDDQCLIIIDAGVVIAQLIHVDMDD